MPHSRDPCRSPSRDAGPRGLGRSPSRSGNTPARSVSRRRGPLDGPRGPSRSTAKRVCIPRRFRHSPSRSVRRTRRSGNSPSPSCCRTPRLCPHSIVLLSPDLAGLSQDLAVVSQDLADGRTHASILGTDVRLHPLETRRFSQKSKSTATLRIFARRRTQGDQEGRGEPPGGRGGGRGPSRNGGDAQREVLAGGIEVGPARQKRTVGLLRDAAWQRRSRRPLGLHVGLVPPS